MNEDELVFDALWTGRIGESVCLPIRELENVTGLGEKAIRASLRRLCEQGRLSYTGRRFRQTAIFKISPAGAAAAGPFGKGSGGAPPMEGSPTRPISENEPDARPTAHSTVCPECCLDRKSEQLLEDHLYNVHGIEQPKPITDLPKVLHPSFGR